MGVIRMLKRRHSVKDVLEKLNITDKTLTSYADLMCEVDDNFADSLEKTRKYSGKEIEVIQYLLRRKSEGISKEMSRDEAAEVYYDQSKCEEVLSEFQCLLDKIKKR